MSIIDHIMAILTPYECLGCEAEGSLLCIACSWRLPRVPERCYRCHRSSPGGRICGGCREASHLYGVMAGTAYSGIAKELVSRLKFAGARATAGIMAERLLPLAGSMDRATVIVPVPTAPSRVRGRGFDQARLLARELSRKSRLSYLDCLARSGHTRQVGTSRLQRLNQLAGSFRVTADQRVRSDRILLIDDVMTTGATLEAAAGTLQAHGAGRVMAMVFAQA